MAYAIDQEKWQRVRQMMERQRSRRRRCARTGQCSLSDELLDDEGLRHRDFSPRRRSHAAGDRTAISRSAAHRLEQRRALLSFLSSQGSAPSHDSRRRDGGRSLARAQTDRRVGIELSQTSQICDRMVGEPTVYTQGFYDAFRAACREIVDAASLLSEVRMIKTPQEIERMRLANELAAIGMAVCARKH